LILSAVLAHILESASLEAAHDLYTVGCWQPWLHYSEETITERFLLRLMQHQWWWSSDLKIQVISVAHVKTGSKAISEPKTGADWEWHFGTPGNNRWFSLRVQAKKAREASGWGFHDIETKRTRRNQRQIDVLIKDASTRYWPIYVLYDGRFLTQSTPLASCHQCPRNPGGFGAVTFADAKSMRELVRRKNMGCSVVRQISRSLPCLIDCPLISISVLIFQAKYVLLRSVFATVFRLYGRNPERHTRFATTFQKYSNDCRTMSSGCAKCCRKMERVPSTDSTENGGFPVRSREATEPLKRKQMTRRIVSPDWSLSKGHKVQ
jgi:hypothetical protein